MNTVRPIKAFADFTDADRAKFNKMHSIRYDLSVLDAASHTLASDKDPDFICCLASKLSNFIQSEVIPLVNNHYKSDTCERENKENPSCDLENN